MDKPQINVYVKEIGRYGAAVLDICRNEFTAAGFENGDVVFVEVRDAKLTMPVVSGYFDVDNGQLLILNNEFDSSMMISRTNSNSFASDYHIERGDPVRITMETKRGYYREFQQRTLAMGLEREDYESDEKFCNFRSVDLPEVKKNYLYRGFSPINPTDHRAEMTDRLLSETDVKTIINLDGEDLAKRLQYPNYEKSFYAGRTIVPIDFKFDPRASSFENAIQTIIQTIIEQQGAFYIHCRYGRDRTGVVCMVLEALCGVPLDGLVEDYMLSYENIHGLVRDTDKWKLMADKRAYAAFEALTGEKRRDLNGSETKKAMSDMLRNRCGISEEALQKVSGKLSEQI